MSSANVGKYVIAAIVSYGTSTFVSYKYNQFTKAQSDLKEVQDQKKFLHQVHQQFAEKYDEKNQKREFSNKLSKYRRIVLSYAQGKTLEVGIGTGENLKYYPANNVEQLIGVDWSDNMLLKAFEKVDEIQREKKVTLPPDYKLMTADAHALPFKDNQFDTVVNTFTLESTYDHEQVLREMKRVCKNHGKILLISRGQSYFSIYNEWLKFKAARDLTHYGTVEHLNIEKIIENTQRHPEFVIEHKEKKNMGMTYIYIIEVDKDPKEEQT